MAMADDLRYRGCQLTNIPLNSRGARLQTINIVLLGKTGVGKSSSGNTILGKNIFKHKKSLKSVTKSSSGQKSVVEGRSVSVIDTPGFFDTTLPEEDLAVEIAWSVFLSTPGPHAFLFVLPVGRFTEQEEEVLTEIQSIFGKDVLKYLILLFTKGDDIEPEEFESEVNEHEKLRKIVESCQGYHIFNNKDENNREQVNDLLQKIDTMIEQNGGGHYSNQMFEEAKRFRQEEEERRQREQEEQRQREQERCSCFGCNCQCAFKRFWQNFNEFFRNIARKMRKRNRQYDNL